LLMATAPLVVFGLWRAATRRERSDLLLLAWIFLYPLGAFLTSEGVPHASRAFLAAPLGALLAALGLAFVLDRAGERKAQLAVAAVAGALVFGNAALALRDFFGRYPVETASAWNEGAEALIHDVERARGHEVRRVHFAPGPLQAGRVWGTMLGRDDVLFFSGF